MAAKSLGSTCNEVAKKMSGDADPHSKYRSPLSARYASPEMSYNFSEQKKFSTWRKTVDLAGKGRKGGLSRIHCMSLTQLPLDWSPGLAGGARTPDSRCH